MAESVAALGAVGATCCMECVEDLVVASEVTGCPEGMWVARNTRLPPDMRRCQHKSATQCCLHNNPDLQSNLGLRHRMALRGVHLRRTQRSAADSYDQTSRCLAPLVVEEASAALAADWSTPATAEALWSWFGKSRRARTALVRFVFLQPYKRVSGRHRICNPLEEDHTPRVCVCVRVSCSLSVWKLAV